MTNEDPKITMSPLCQTITRQGKSVKVEIYDDGEGGWLLEVIDQYDNSTCWEDSFKTDEAALNEVLDTIEKEGIEALIVSDTGNL